MLISEYTGILLMVNEYENTRDIMVLLCVMMTVSKEKCHHKNCNGTQGHHSQLLWMCIARVQEKGGSEDWDQ